MVIRWRDLTQVADVINKVSMRADVNSRHPKPRTNLEQTSNEQLSHRKLACITMPVGDGPTRRCTRVDSVFSAPLRFDRFQFSPIGYAPALLSFLGRCCCLWARKHWE